MPLRILFATLLLSATASAIDLRYWVEPCTHPDTSCKKEDPQLAEWALQSWQKSSTGKLHLEKTSDMLAANIRIHWASAEDGQYGETRMFTEGSLKGADVYVRPDISGMDPDIFALANRDPLLRETIVYLTCLHETGHALGLSHTTDFPDIMYTFQAGGNIPEYFGRYRRLLHERNDIADHSGLSLSDRVRLQAALR
jgi:hypothetical protein